MFPAPHRFVLALSFYTRLPCPKSLDFAQLPQAAVYLPVVGWIVGGASGLAFYLAHWILPTSTAVIAALVAGIFLTGAFHEDGFADVCDGFGGGYGKERILEIMKDSAIGVYGALGLILLISIKISLLGSFAAAEIPWLFLTGHSISRLTPLLLMRRYDYARSNHSKSGGAMIKPEAGHLAFAVVAALLPFIFLPPGQLLTIPPVLLACFWLGHYFFRHIGGYTGDCLGACQQVCETVFYLGAAVIWTFI